MEPLEPHPLPSGARPPPTGNPQNLPSIPLKSILHLRICSLLMRICRMVGRFPPVLAAVLGAPPLRRTSAMACGFFRSSFLRLVRPRPRWLRPWRLDPAWVVPRSRLLRRVRWREPRAGPWRLLPTPRRLPRRPSTRRRRHHPPPPPGYGLLRSFPRHRHGGWAGSRRRGLALRHAQVGGAADSGRRQSRAQSRHRRAKLAAGSQGSHRA
ncbi:hypothetical protein PVAP13_7NG175534 [Panicum virgatum]|uniref:Uncharacterized protein n=1 Tax=Panicum virgatum TaxID=38727 RepID=A0A8T0Q6R3_PANVG|nr:hypothetical protein PVAP13_7NG175534 [Panicum virgatum]